jgi:hypothetical protein
MSEKLSWIIVALLALIVWELDAIRSRLKRQFPTAEGEDSRWAQEDPMGHWEANKDEIQSKRRAER